MSFEVIEQNPNYKLFDFQDKGLNETLEDLEINKSTIAVAPTGAGKAVILSAAAFKHVKRHENSVAIFVHKQELLEQTRQTLLDWYGIIAQPIDSTTKHIRPSRVYVIMVETFDRRSSIVSFMNNFKNIGLLIIDEVHLNTFNKILSHFWESLRLGFTATPVSATKKDPMKNRWKSINIIATTEQLIELNSYHPDMGIVPADCYAPKNIKRSDLKKKGEEFDESEMGKTFSKSPQIKNTFDAYIKRGYNKKTVIFNANIAHSLLVMQEFKDAGFNVRHLDSDKGSPYSSDKYRKETLLWLKNTPNAILCNVGILTTGFDEKSIECVIINKSTMSFTLFIQMCGRGARAYVYPDGSIKTHYTLIDMGDNIEGGKFGNPNKNADWKYMFENPTLPRPSPPPIKICPQCGAMNTAGARMCLGKEYSWLLDEEWDCEYIFPVSVKEADLIPVELVRIFSDKIKVEANIEFFKDRKQWFTFHETRKQMINIFTDKIKTKELELSQVEYITEEVLKKCQEWFKLTGAVKYREWKKDVRNRVLNELQEKGFIIDPQEVENLTL
jgi:superfamily II DNA or RNA helicase